MIAYLEACLVFNLDNKLIFGVDMSATILTNSSTHNTRSGTLFISFGSWTAKHKRIEANSAENISADALLIASFWESIAI